MSPADQGRTMVSFRQAFEAQPQEAQSAPQQQKKKRNKSVKQRNRWLTLEYVRDRQGHLTNAGYPPSKWLQFAEMFLELGYEVKMHEAQKGVSKYLKVKWGDLKTYQVRFSNHKPNKSREENGDCDFFVGRTHFGTTTTAQAIEATFEHFRKQNANL